MVTDTFSEFLSLTFPQMLLRNRDKHGDEIAWRQKEFGIWYEFRWEEIYQRVKYLSLGMISLGFQPGDKISISGDNDRHWFWAELAAQAARGTVTGVFVDSMTDEVKHIVGHSDSKFVVVQDQEQVDKLLRIKNDLPLIEKIIYWDPKGLKYYDDPALMSFDHVIELGKEYEKLHPNLFEENVAQGKPDDLACILYTSGTSGLPKGAQLSYFNLIDSTVRWLRLLPAQAGDDYVSFTLPGWIVEQMIGLGQSLIARTKVNFPETIETVKENIIEVCPEMLMYASRLWEAENSVMQAKINDSSAFKKFVFNLFLPVGVKIAEFKQLRHKPNALWKALYALADMSVFHPLRTRHGLHKVRTPVTAGALLGPDVYRFFHAIGLDLRQCYGITEAGNVAAQKEDDIRFDAIGRPLPGVEIRISEDTEILVARKNCFVGYYKSPEVTEKALAGGWYHSGDAGYIADDGQLIFMDRLSDLRQLKDGTKFSPQFVESQLKFSPHIKDAMIVESEDMSRIAAIINIDYQNVGDWAERRHIPYTTFIDLSQQTEIRNLIRAEVERINRKLPPAARIKRFVNLYKDFDADEAELTRTKKLRRSFMVERYRELVDVLFGVDKELKIESRISYLDGRTGVVTATVHIEDL